MDPNAHKNPFLVQIMAEKHEHKACDFTIVGTDTATSLTDPSPGLNRMPTEVPGNSCPYLSSWLKEHTLICGKGNTYNLIEITIFLSSTPLRQD